MDGAMLTADEFEQALSPLVLSAPENGIFQDTTFLKVSKLLARLGKKDWSLRPRTYTVLRMINRADYMDQFVTDGLLDVHLPYTLSTLPPKLSEASRHTFISRQNAVLTAAKDVEVEDGRHRHFNVDADAYFNLRGPLGKGKFGVVDRVEGRLSLEEFARKRIYKQHPDFRHRKDAIRSLENELKNLKRLRHHHLVSFVGSYTDRKYVAILMTPIADCDLRYFLARAPFPSNELSIIRSFFGCLCGAVKYLHQKRVRHKDIKTANILVKNHEVYLTDFGTARDWSELTRGTTDGPPGPYTPRFAAPEVADAVERNASSDIWSLGCVYLDILCVLKGYKVDDMLEFFDKHGNGHKWPCRNPDALNKWLLHLQESKMDNAPLKWIRQMLNFSRLDRPAAYEVFDTILAHEDESTYIGPCCSAEGLSDVDSSYQGSVVGDSYDDNLTAVRAKPLLHGHNIEHFSTQPVQECNDILTYCHRASSASARSKGKLAIGEHPCGTMEEGELSDPLLDSQNNDLGDILMPKTLEKQDQVESSMRDSQKPQLAVHETIFGGQVSPTTSAAERFSNRKSQDLLNNRSTAKDEPTGGHTSLKQKDATRARTLTSRGLGRPVHEITQVREQHSVMNNEDSLGEASEDEEDTQEGYASDFSEGQRAYQPPKKAPRQTIIFIGRQRSRNFNQDSEDHYDDMASDRPKSVPASRPRRSSNQARESTTGSSSEHISYEKLRKKPVKRHSDSEYRQKQRHNIPDDSRARQRSSRERRIPRHTMPSETKYYVPPTRYDDMSNPFHPQFPETYHPQMSQQTSYPRRSDAYESEIPSPYHTIADYDPWKQFAYYFSDQAPHSKLVRHDVLQSVYQYMQPRFNVFKKVDATRTPRVILNDGSGFNQIINNDRTGCPLEGPLPFGLLTTIIATDPNRLERKPSPIGKEQHDIKSFLMSEFSPFNNCKHHSMGLLQAACVCHTHPRSYCQCVTIGNLRR